MHYVPKIAAVLVIGVSLAAIYIARRDDRTRADWARDVAPLCSKYEEIASHHVPPPDASSKEMADELDAMLAAMRPYPEELREVEQPTGDERVDEWVDLQEEGHEVIADFSHSLRSGTRDDLRDDWTRLVQFTGRDRQAADGLGLPENCLSDPPPEP